MPRCGAGPCHVSLGNLLRRRLADPRRVTGSISGQPTAKQRFLHCDRSPNPAILTRLLDLSVYKVSMPASEGLMGAILRLIPNPRSNRSVGLGTRDGWSEIGFLRSDSIRMKAKCCRRTQFYLPKKRDFTSFPPTAGRVPISVF